MRDSNLWLSPGAKPCRYNVELSLKLNNVDRYPLRFSFLVKEALDGSNMRLQPFKLPEVVNLLLGLIRQGVELTR